MYNYSYVDRTKWHGRHRTVSYDIKAEHVFAAIMMHCPGNVVFEAHRKTKQEPSLKHETQNKLLCQSNYAIDLLGGREAYVHFEKKNQSLNRPDDDALGLRRDQRHRLCGRAG